MVRTNEIEKKLLLEKHIKTYFIFKNELLRSKCRNKMIAY